MISRARSRFVDGRHAISHVAAGLALGTSLLLSAALPACAQQAPAGKGTTAAPATSHQIPGTSNRPGATGNQPTATSTMQLRCDVGGDLSYRIITAQDESAAPAPLPAPTGAGNLVVLPIAVKPAGATLEVIDNARGKVAHLPVATTGMTPLTDTDFNLLLAVLVPVQSKGKAVVNATVTLTAPEGKAVAPAAGAVKPAGTAKPAAAPGGKGYSRSWLLKPSDGGVASFANVPLGVPVTVTVSSGSDTPISQTLTLPTNPPAEGYRWQTIEVPWTTVHTVPLPAAPAPIAGAATGTTAPVAAPAAPAPQPASNPVSELINTLVSLAILAGVGYGLLWAYKQGHIKKMLDNLGIQTQPIAATAGPQGNPFEKPARAPIQPITEGTADPLAGGAGFAAGGMAMAAPPVVGTGPRLVATMGTYAGSIFPLAPTLTDIGRDTTNPVALPQDTNASRRHATIQADNGQYSVTDNGSSNGTYVNGVRIAAQAPQPLRPGDELQVGMTRFRFEA